MRLQGSFNFTEFNAVTADFDLLICSSQELKGAITPIPAKVPCSVPALATLFDEFTCCGRGISPVAQSNPGATDPKLSRHPIGTIATSAVNCSVFLVR